jgi:hypothetical protein
MSRRVELFEGPGVQQLDHAVATPGHHRQALDGLLRGAPEGGGTFRSSSVGPEADNDSWNYDLRRSEGVAMADHGPLALRYIEACEAFNSGDTDKFGAMLIADNCVFDSSDGRVGSTGPEIVAALKAARAAMGWEKHEVISSNEADPVLAVIARNSYTGRDGTQVVAGIAKFEGGKLVEMRSVDGPRPPRK